MLTNFKTVRQSIKRLKDLDLMAQDGTFDRLAKKEVIGLRREMDKLERSLGRHQGYGQSAGCAVRHRCWPRAISRFRKPTSWVFRCIGVVDTNNSPDGVNYVIPGNDDAIRAIQLYVGGVAEAVLEGRCCNDYGSQCRGRY
jgi:small subunit ribosomal protein S2